VAVVVYADIAGGGGAGGFRDQVQLVCQHLYSFSFSNPTGLPVSEQSYPITVGAGGGPTTAPGVDSRIPGSDSIFSTITSAGGGGGGARQLSSNFL
jgi:hypothetical protein